MNKLEFKFFCANEFKKYGCTKVKNGFYLRGDDILCGIFFQKSNFGEYYYINYDFHFPKKNDLSYPSHHNMHMYGGRFRFISKQKTENTPIREIAEFEYQKITTEELTLIIKSEFERSILPPLQKGKKYILENMETLYGIQWNHEEVLRLLQE